jgi:glycosyltransferase involved in cell wall biosynthesis
MTYHGSVSNEDVREALTNAHVFAYPSIWPETSCICLMEAMSAGLMCVHPNFGALPETAANWTQMYQFHEDANGHARTFYGVLKDVIDHVLSDNYKDDSKLMGQKSYVDLFYSWDLRKIQWENFLRSFANESKEIKKAPMFHYKTS